MSQVSIKKCKDYNPQDVQRAVEEAVGLLGGIGMFVKPGEKVLIKPNLLSARPPEHGVCTHLEVIRAVIRLAKGAGATVSVGDSPGGFELIDLDKLYEITGIKKVCAQEDVNLVKFDIAENTDGIPIAKAVKEADVIIDAPKMKTHGLTVLTGAVKNMFGSVIGKYKAECHFKHTDNEDFARHLVKIFSLVKPALVVMDGIVAMQGDGPAAGKLCRVGLILAGDDAVAVDAVFAHIVGTDPLNVPTTKYAYEQGLGEAKLDKIKIAGEPLESAVIKDFILPKASLVYIAPGWVKRLLGNLIRIYPYIDSTSCVSCRICEKNCPATAIDINKYHIDYSKCIFCFCCNELCPQKAVGVRKSIGGNIFEFIMKMRRLCRPRQ